MSRVLLNSLEISPVEAEFALAGSKSISQRVLIINYLSDLNINVNNLSDSDDTTVLHHGLYCGESIINVKNSGTALRFLMSVFALKNINVTLTGSQHLLKRPMKSLIELLNLLGGSVSKDNNGIHIKTGCLVGSALNCDLMLTSQFISSILLISPYLKNGMTLNLPHKIYSRPYVEMTVSIMQDCGAQVAVNDNYSTICVSNTQYSKKISVIESDWTSASYLFLAFIFSDLNTIKISSLYQESIQNDQVIIDFFALLGVVTQFVNNNIILTKKTNLHLPKKIEWNFTHNPDLFPTILVACFGLGIELFAVGLTTLAYKESNRIITMKNELSKFNCDYKLESEDSICMTPIGGDNVTKELICIDTYQDHRIALALAPLTLLGWKLQINNSNVITKSYPNFWTDLCKFGVQIKRKSK